MKKIFFVVMVISILSLGMWSLVHFLNGNQSGLDLDYKLESIRAQEAVIVALLAYIAWRVTPDSMQK